MMASAQPRLWMHGMEQGTPGEAGPPQRLVEIAARPARCSSVRRASECTRPPRRDAITCLHRRPSGKPPGHASGAGCFSLIFAHAPLTVSPSASACQISRSYSSWSVSWPSRLVDASPGRPASCASSVLTRPLRVPQAASVRAYLEGTPILGFTGQPELAAGSEAEGELRGGGMCMLGSPATQLSA